MKMRALLLLALMISGAFVMFQSYKQDGEKAFIDLLTDYERPFHSLTFTKPSNIGGDVKTWTIETESEIDSFITFLQNYRIRKISPTNLSVLNQSNQFSILLHDEAGNELHVILNENIIIQDSFIFYEVVDGPLDLDWLLTFFLHNE